MMRHSGLVVIKLIFVMPSPPPFFCLCNSVLNGTGMTFYNQRHSLLTVQQVASTHFLTVLQIAGTHFLRYQPGCYYYTMLRIKTLPLSPGYKWTREKKLAHISRYPPPPGGGGGHYSGNGIFSCPAHPFPYFYDEKWLVRSLLFFRFFFFSFSSFLISPPTHNSNQNKKDARTAVLSSSSSSSFSSCGSPSTAITRWITVGLIPILVRNQPPTDRLLLII